MIEKLVNEIAAEMSVPLSAIQMIDGRRLGIKGSYLLKMTMNDRVASTMLYRDPSMDSTAGSVYERIGCDIRNAMCRLQISVGKTAGTKRRLTDK